MSEEYNAFLKSFKKALKKKEAGKFGVEDVKAIHKTARNLFDGETYLDQGQLCEIRDTWVQLADGKIDKASAMKKLQGTSRAEAIQSVLMSSLK
ncbi:MAG: hypothetical protein VX777_06675 [Chlamydiota bacterium]|nr:hypothetical protein [Chlamydiota bacterium]